jgi:hypothetical protein
MFVDGTQMFEEVPRMGYLCTVTLSLSVLTGQPSDSVIHRLEAEVARVRVEVAERVPAGSRTPLEGALSRAEDALKKGRPALAVYELEQPWEAVSTERYLESQGHVATKEAFADLWRRHGEPMPSAGTTRLPAVVEALATAAEARAPATYRASLSLGTDADVPSGLFYLGSASAFVEFASFVRQLPWPQPAGDAPPFRSLAPELTAFERTVASAYETMERAEHAPYVRTDVTIKQARTLNDGAKYGAAVLEYLLARYRFASIHSPAPPGDLSRLREARAALPPGRDDSIAQFFLDLAEEESAANNAERGAAAIVVDDVLPAYSAALAEGTASAISASQPEVTVTLVRWPFT